jgi:methionyl aminopeptidase
MCEDDRVSIDDPDELAALRAVGRVVAEAIREMARRVRPGVTTTELDGVAAEIFARHGARSGPRLDYDFPGTTCISVNDECVHGIPSKRRLREGQLCKLDVTAELDGFYADACRTVPVGRIKPREQRLSAAAQSALRCGLAAAHAGNNVGAIGAAVQAEVERRGFSVCAELTGHGIGRRIHEEPDVPNIAWDGPELTNGLVITVEPIISAGAGDVYVDDDGWTIRTEDGSPSAHFEHTIVVTDGAPILVTA